MSNETRPLNLDENARKRSAKERAFRWLLFACAALSILVTIGIVVTLLVDAVDFFTDVSPLAFFTGASWNPAIAPFSFGVLPLIGATLMVTGISAMISLPIGVAAAIYLSEYADARVRSVLKPALEILAGIPTVVYGYFALVYLTPALRTIGIPLSTFNVLSASIMVGIMIIPMVSSLSEDAMNAVPDSLRQASYGLGATKFEVSTGVVIPAAISGIFSSFILALSRAIGETMIVVMAMGSNPRMFDFANPLDNLLRSNQAMTAAMVEVGISDLTTSSTAYKSMFAIGLTLFVITFAMNVVSNWITARYKEEYQ